LKDITCWGDAHEDTKKITPMKHMSNNFQLKNSKANQIEIETLDIGLLMNALAKHLANCKVSKEVEKMAKLREMVA
jgi:hypothetical protein